MSEQKRSGMWQNIRANALNLSTMAIVAAAALAMVYILTSPLIINNQRLAQIAALTQVMPSQYFDQELLQHSFSLPHAEQLNQDSKNQGYMAWQEGKINGWILPVTSLDGYSGPIHMLVGIDAYGGITGVRITRHKETPGLGDKIDYQKSHWVDDFIGAKLTTHKWAVGKDGGDFDQFTGATITPRAVVNAVKASLTYLDQHQADLLTVAQVHKEEH